MCQEISLKTMRRKLFLKLYVPHIKKDKKEANLTHYDHITFSNEVGSLISVKILKFSSTEETASSLTRVRLLNYLLTEERATMYVMAA